MSAAAFREPLDQVCLAAWRWGFRWFWPYTPTAVSSNAQKHGAPPRLPLPPASPTIGSVSLDAPTLTAGGLPRRLQPIRPLAARVANDRRRDDRFESVSGAHVLALLNRAEMEPEAVKVAMLTLERTVLALAEQPPSAFAGLLFTNDETGELIDATRLVEMQMRNLWLLRKRLRQYLWGY